MRKIKELKILHDWVKEEVEFGGFSRKSRGRRRESPEIAREEEGLGGEREKRGRNEEKEEIFSYVFI